MSSNLIDRLTAEADASDVDAEAFSVRLQTAWDWSTKISPDLDEGDAITTKRTLEVEADMPFLEDKQIVAIYQRKDSVVPTIRIGALFELEPPFSEAAARQFFTSLRAASDSALNLLAKNLKR
ncbi:hypothetical protein ACFLSW_00730 [Candidatus Bipolaricaulota bacterium]